MTTELLYSLAGQLGVSSVAAYLGVRVALAQIRGDIIRIDGELKALHARANRLEEPYFREKAL